MQAFIFSSAFMGGFSIARTLSLSGESDRLGRSPHGVRQPTAAADVSTGLSQTNDCETLQPGGSCTITLTFDPSLACGDSGASGVQIVVTDSLLSSPTQFQQPSFVFLATVLGG